MGSWIARGTLALLLALPARADASAPEVEVAWSGPEACPRTRFVEGLARHLAESDAGPVEIVAEVREADGRWQLVATLSTGGAAYAPRQFSARSCEAVVDAAALAAAIAIDPLHVADEPAPELAVPEPSAPTPEPTAIAAPLAAQTEAAPAPAAGRTSSRRVPPTRRATLVRGFVAIAAAVDGGALPGVGVGPSGSLGLIRRRLRVELVAGWRAPVRVESLEDPNAGARVDLLLLGARVCGTMRTGRAIELPLCAGLDSGVIRGRGFGLADNSTATLAWLAASATAGVAWVATDRLALFARSELGVPLLLHSFEIRGLATIDRVAPVYGRGLFGLEVRFP